MTMYCTQELANKKEECHLKKIGETSGGSSSTKGEAAKESPRMEAAEVEATEDEEAAAEAKRDKEAAEPPGQVSTFIRCTFHFLIFNHLNRNN